MAFSSPVPESTQSADNTVGGWQSLGNGDRLPPLRSPSRPTCRCLLRRNNFAYACGMKGWRVDRVMSWREMWPSRLIGGLLLLSGHRACRGTYARTGDVPRRRTFCLTV